MKIWGKDFGYRLTETERKHLSKDKTYSYTVKIDGEKKINDYCKIIPKFKLSFEDCEPAIVKKGEQKESFTKGKIKISIKADLESDYNKVWEDTAGKTLIRAFMHKYVMHSDLSKFEKIAKHELKQLEKTFGAYLNLHNL